MQPRTARLRNAHNVYLFACWYRVTLTCFDWNLWWRKPRNTEGSASQPRATLFGVSATPTVCLLAWYDGCNVQTNTWKNTIKNINGDIFVSTFTLPIIKNIINTSFSTSILLTKITCIRCDEHIGDGNIGDGWYWYSRKILIKC